MAAVITVTTLRPDKPVRVTTPYNAEFVEALKAAVPHTDREWVPEERNWYVTAEHRETVCQLVLRHFDDPLLTEPGDGGLVTTDLKTGRRLHTQPTLF